MSIAGYALSALDALRSVRTIILAACTNTHFGLESKGNSLFITQRGTTFCIKNGSQLFVGRVLRQTKSDTSESESESKTSRYIWLADTACCEKINGK